MMHCPGEGTLLDLTSVLGDDPREALLHLSSCASCLEGMSRLTSLRRELSHETEPRSGFTSEVMATIAAGRESGAAGVAVAHPPADSAGSIPRVGAWLDVANPLLATICTFFAVLLVGQPALQPGLPVISVAIAVGGATLWWNRRGHDQADAPM